MKRLHLSLPELLFVIATRAALAAGVGLLLSDRLRRGNRRKFGLTLITVGALTTLPAAIFVRQGFRREDQQRRVA